MEFHKIADLFPMMQSDELANLIADIKRNGLIESIVLFEDKILDGRNRWLACGETGIKPHFDYYKGNEPVNYVISKNLHRRHLTPTQLGIIARKIENTEQCDNQYTGYANLHDHKISRKQASEIVGVSPRTIASIKEIEINAPELMPKLESGEMTVNRAIQEMRRKQVKDNLNNIEIIEAKEIEGIFDVIVIDPPWQMKKIERNVAPNQVEFEYPTITIEDIKKLKIPCADDCHVWLWTTHKFLPIAFNILKNWNLKYVCTFVWHKQGGFQPFGLPQYNNEFALYARRGSPKFTTLKDFKLCFNASRGAHSEKPEYFYQMIKNHTAGRRLDMFNRRIIDGFDTWGKEAK